MENDTAITNSDLSKTEEAKKVLGKVKLSAQPKVLIELNRMVQDEDIDFERISDLISSDIGLSAKLLKLASSPIYSNGRTYGSIKEALMTIGFEEFQLYFRTAYLSDFLGKMTYAHSGFQTHSTRIALYSKLIAEEVLPELTNDAYTLGLFHDVGAVLIPNYCKDYVEHIHRALPLYFGITDLEFNLIKTNHCVVGELFAKNWGISQDILTALRYHHRPDSDPDWNDNAIALKFVLQLAEALNDKLSSKNQQFSTAPKSIENLNNICEYFELDLVALEELEEKILETTSGKVVA